MSATILFGTINDSTKVISFAGNLFQKSTAKCFLNGDVREATWETLGTKQRTGL